SFTLAGSAAGVEGLILTGDLDTDGTGNSLDNDIIGNGGDNSLFGGGGSDTIPAGLGNGTLDAGTSAASLSGSAGDDVYRVDDLLDVVTESGGNGTDRVESSVTWTLGLGLENLVLLGSAAISGTGNGLDNVIKGNSAANTLTGGDGHDALDG